MSDVDVSVVIPSYNRLWALPDAVESCRNTSCNTEIIVVDDGSSDGTWEWLQQQRDVFAIRQANQGQTYAANRGTLAARGRYVRYLDSDDRLTPGIIDLQLAAADAHEADVVYARVDDLDSRTGLVTEHEDAPLWDDFLAVQLGEGDGFHMLGMLFRREVALAVPRRPDFAHRDDRMFLLEVGLRQPKLARVPGCAGYWVRHDRQMHDRYPGLVRIIAEWQHVGIYRFILRELADRGALTQRRRRAAAPIIWNLAHQIARVDIAEGRRVADWALSLDPDLRRGSRTLGWMYANLGFTSTEALLRFRRAALEPVRSRLAGRIGSAPESPDSGSGSRGEFTHTQQTATA